MLKMRASRSVESAVKYFQQSLRQSDYLAKDAVEKKGYWYGSTAKLLGLEPSEEITEEAFVRLLKNQHPTTGDQITPRKKKDGIPSYEFVFSLPKPVTVMALYDPAIMKLFEDSVHETLDELESYMRVRVDEGGGKKSERVTGNMISGLHWHMTSRPVDGIPDFGPHVHATAMNLTFSETHGRFMAGQFRELKHDYFQQFFHNVLAQKLQGRGYEVEVNKDGFDLAGVPKSLSEKYSRRTKQITDYAEKHGLNLSDPLDKEKAWEGSREPKPKEPMSMAELREEWRSRASVEEKRALASVVKKRDVAEPVTSRVSAKEAVQYSIADNFQNRSVVDEKKLLATAIHYGLGQVDAGEVKHALEHSELLFREYQGRRRATLPELRDAENLLLDFAERQRGQFDPLGGYGWKFKKPKNQPLNKDQIKAIKQINQSHDGVLVLRGSPGTGKSSLLKRAIAQMKPGTNIFAFGTTTRSRDVLRSDGFKSAETLQMLLTNPRMQAEIRDSFVIVDETGMADSRSMRDLVKVLQSQHARLLVLGDDKQHGSVGAGRPFRLLVEHSSLPIMEVREIVRQKTEAYRNVVATVDRGDAAGGLKKIDDLGWVTQEKDASNRYAALAREYVEIAKENPDNVLSIAPTHVERNAVQQAIRAALRAEPRPGGKTDQTMLDKEEHEILRLAPIFATDAKRGNPDFLREHVGATVAFFQNAKGKFVRGSRAIVTDVDHERNVWVKTDAGERKRLPTETPGRYQLFETTTLKVAAGDRLRFTGNGKTKEGGKVSNGNFVTVQGFTNGGDLILDKKKTLPKRFGSVDWGYAVTSIGAQGETVPGNLLLAQSRQSLGASFINQFLVSISRAKISTRVFTDSKEALSKAVERRDEEITATEFLEATRPKKEAMKTADAWQEHTLRRHRIGLLLRHKLKNTVEKVHRQAKTLQQQFFPEDRNMVHER